jgi:TetR/AcrR family transcriptional regulator, cholesterol catabolism regulator
MEELIKRISVLFMRYGIRSVTMDDIARELSISKKTLYQHFTDKDDLVKKIVESYLNEQKCEITRLCTYDMNAIDILLIISKYLTKQMTEINLSVNYDLQKYYPECWKVVENYRETHMLENIRLNITNGIKQGLYRNDFNIDIIAKGYILRFNPDDNIQDWIKNSGLTFEEVYQTLFIYHIRGIANKKGLEYLEQKIKNDQIK